MSETDWPPPPYLVRTPRLRIRAYERADVDTMHEVVLANADALRPWMPWIEHEPLSRDQRAELVRRFRGEFDLGMNFIYGIYDAKDGAYLGGTGLHPRQGPGVLEIGYWLRVDAQGRGLATEAAAALTQVAFRDMGAARVEIRVAPHNAASLRVPVKLGFEREGQLRRVGSTGTDDGVDLVVFGMLRGELAESLAAEVPIEVEGFA